jgi:hypothetical protein
MPAPLQTLAALTWGAAIAAALTPVHGRIFACSLGAAVVVSLAALEQKMVAHGARLYTAMTKAAITRPPYEEPPAVFPVIQLDGYRQHGRHASRGLAPA